MKTLGVDIGTTTISAVVMDMDKSKVIKDYTIGNGSFLTTSYLWEKIQDPVVIITKARNLIDKILKDYPEIERIGLTGQMHGIVYLNERGNAVSPLYTWQDRRCDEKYFDGKSISQFIEDRTGRKVPTGYGLATHVFNIKKNLVPSDAVQICTIMDYLGMTLTGKAKPLMHSSNAASLGFYNGETSQFEEEDLKIFGVDTRILPAVTECFTIIGEYKKRLVSVAIGDNQASFLGSVEDMENTVLVNMGTGGQISILSNQYYVADNIEARPFMKGKYLLAGSSLCGGRAYATLEKFFKSYVKVIGIETVDHYAIMEKLLENRREDERLIVDTRFSGTRSDPELRGRIDDISTENFTPAALTYGVLDGMAEELYEMYQTIEAGTGQKKIKIVASGNGMRKNKWLQKIVSEKFHMPLQLAEYEEEAAVGAVRSAVLID